MFNFKFHGRQLAPNRCSFGGVSVWDVIVQPSPGSCLSCEMDNNSRVGLFLFCYFLGGLLFFFTSLSNGNFSDGKFVSFFPEESQLRQSRVTQPELIK